MTKKFLFVLLLALPLAAFPSKTGLMPGVYEVLTSLDGAAPEKSRSCITPEAADVGYVPPPPSPDCRISRSTFAGGRIDVLQVCKNATVVISGSYTATSLVMDEKLQVKTPKETVTSASHSVAKRVGDTCKGDED